MTGAQGFAVVKQIKKQALGLVDLTFDSDDAGFSDCAITTCRLSKCTQTKSVRDVSNDMNLA